MTTNRITQIIKGVASGLDAIHQAGFVHANLRCKNIFMTDALVPKIGEIKNCKLVKDEEDKRWWAPELFKQVSHLTPRVNETQEFNVVEVTF